MALTKQQQNDYFRTQGSAANPLSPAQFEASLGGITKTPVSASNPLGTITPDLAEPIAPTPFSPVSMTSAYPVGAIDSTFALKPKEQEASGLNQEIRDLQNSLIGESAYRTSKSDEYGISGLEKTQQDLSTNLTQLKNEALAIPIQLQNESEGRGRTVGGIAPIESGRLRDNAIRALTTSSLLEASRGNLALAMQQVDRAVAQKYDPIKEKINIKLANLELIMKSPEYSLEDKKRAAEQTAIQEEEKAKVKVQEENTKLGSAMAAAATKNYPGDDSVSVAVHEALALDPQDEEYTQKVYDLLGQYQSDPIAVQKSIADIEKVRAETAKIPFDIEKTKAETALTYVNLAKAQHPDIGQLGEIATAYFKDARAQKFVNISNIMDTVNAHVPDRTDATYKEIAKDEAEVTTLLAQKWLMDNPGSARLGDNGDLAVPESDLAQIALRAKKIVQNTSTSLTQVKSLVENMDKTYSGSEKSFNFYTEDFKTRYGQDVVLPAFPKLNTEQKSLEERVKAAGYDYQKMINDGLTIEQIEQALSGK